MTTFTKYSDQPLTYQFNIQEDLSATYELDSILYTPKVLENSAEITLNLIKKSDNPSTCTHSFFQIMNELNGEKNIKIRISTADNNGKIITHQESGTHIERPISKKKW